MATNFSGKDARTSGRVAAYRVEHGDDENCLDSAQFTDKRQAVAYYNRLGNGWIVKRFYEMILVRKPGSKEACLLI